ncbi:calmodulin 5 [Mus musculus]|uniref:Calmodulin 5 n=1 Tax=Mus musculus TaxID=10090 RepID=Q6W3E0_MOUSE|nr:calmodulin 5 [Mus musculus]AAQ73342.1 skin calmodulin-related protein 2 [Mus musculus]|eukprot:NP_001008706.1 calmodulin 5 [Mus musculus]
MSHGFTKEENKDGHINVQELGDVMKQLGKNLSHEELKALISKLDTDGDGKISFEEFFKSIKKYTKEQELQAMFSVLDQNGDGYITVDELKEGLSKMGEPLSQEELEGMIHVFGADQDGKVNYEQFLSHYIETVYKVHISD